MFTISQTHTFLSADNLTGDELLILSAGKDTYCLHQDGCLRLPTARELNGLFPADTRLLVTGTLDGAIVCGANLPRNCPPLPEPFFPLPAREIFLCGQPDLVNAVCRTRTLTAWADLHRFCGRCGRPLAPAANDLALACPDCHACYYPQLTPAVIVAVSRNHGTELLLAHNKRFEDRVFGLLAGFVEAGESVEQAVSREIMEEAGITVKNITYLHSQPWPFPNSLMLAFTAELDAGEARPDGEEIAELGWFNRDNLPALPRPGSIAANVIHTFFGLAD